MKKLNELIDFYGSDKNASNYTYAYVHFFEDIRLKINSLLEIGIGTLVEGAKSSMHDWKTDHVSEYKQGASLRAWADYFPNAKIYGGDIQPDTQFSTEKINTFLFNSQDSVECTTALKDLTFDIIIDDGNHDPSSQIKTFINLISRVNTNGFYVIEDVCLGNSDQIIQYTKPIAEIFGFESYIVNPEKNLIVFKRYNK